MAAQPTTRWQVSGYRFLMRRMGHALVRRDVRMIHDPLRSQSRALAVGTVVACLGLAGCAALALFRPQDRIGDAAVVVGRESGALYVAIDGTFHPALNLASARLVLGSPVEPVVVADDQLADRPRGPLVGIPGAPSSLAHDSDDRPWTVCDTVEPHGVHAVTTAVVVGAPETGNKYAPARRRSVSRLVRRSFLLGVQRGSSRDRPGRPCVDASARYRCDPGSSGESRPAWPRFPKCLLSPRR